MHEQREGRESRDAAVATGPVFRVWSDRRRGSHGHCGGPGGAALIRGQLGRLGQPDRITQTTLEDFQDFTQEREGQGGQRQGECRGFPSQEGVPPTVCWGSLLVSDI